MAELPSSLRISRDSRRYNEALRKAPLTELLTSTAAENRLPHAILLTGESGSGRRTIAKYIAKLFMCGAPPCGGCAACNKIDQDSHPDVIYVLDKCGGTYNIKQVREYVCDNTAVKPNDGDIKVYILRRRIPSDQTHRTRC